MKVYVVTQPEEVRGIYQSWDECLAATSGVRGVRQQSVDSLEKAEAMLDGGVVLPVGKWIFTDGNAKGGVGVAVVNKGPGDSVDSVEVATSVDAVFSTAEIRGLRSSAEVAAALARLRNILAELAGLYHALSHISDGMAATVVYDYEGVGAWMERRWQTKDDVVTAVVAACHSEIRRRSLNVSYQHQRGHQKTWAGRDDFASWNARADDLATRGTADRAEGNQPA